MYELMKAQNKKKKHFFLIQNNNLTNHSLFLFLHLLCVERGIGKNNQYSIVLQYFARGY